MDAWRDDAIVYTVRSYQTPIAWVLRTGEAIVPQVKYSRTTSGHQGLLYALDRPLADFADRAGAERQAQRDRAARRNEPAPTRVPWENDWPTGAQLGFPSTRQPAEPSASQPDDVLTRIRRALEEAEHSVPDTYFDGPASLLDAPDLAYSDR